MTDIFTHTPAPKAKPRVGSGNAMFLSDLAVGVPDQTMWERFKAGDYPDLHTPSLKAWRNLAGRTERKDQ